MNTSLKRRDYRKYVWSRQELLFAVLKSAVVVMLLAFFFYKSLWAVFPLIIVGVFYFRSLSADKTEKCRQQLEQQFKECIMSVSTSLRAGYAVENAFMESRRDMYMLFGEQSLIYQELELIRRGLVINITLEELLRDFAERSDSAVVRQFAEIFVIAKRNGGNLPEIISGCSRIIGQKIDAGGEIQTLLSGRRMEQIIMEVMPFGILLYVDISYPGYFDVLYHNWQGVGIMTVCLILYLGAYILGERILNRIALELAA